MLKLTMSDIAEANDWNDLDPKDESFCIYLVQDEDTTLYIGKSIHPLHSLAEQFGLSYWYRSSGLSTFYDEHKSLANSRIIKLYTLQDCLPYILQMEPNNVGRFKRRMNENDLDSWCIDMAKRVMLLHFRPCLNVIGNPDPAPLPLRYRQIK